MIVHDSAGVCDSLNGRKYKVSEERAAFEMKLNVIIS